jgi:hypothetical protein
VSAKLVNEFQTVGEPEKVIAEPSPPADNHPLNSDKAVELLAKQGLLDGALRKANKLRNSGIPGTPSDEEIRHTVFDALIDDAKEHFEYGRYEESEETLKQAAATNAEPGYDPQKDLRNWKALAQIVKAKQLADDGDQKGGEVALSEAIKLDSSAVPNETEMRQILESKVLVKQATDAIISINLDEATRVIKAAAPFDSQTSNQDLNVSTKVIDVCRSEISTRITSHLDGEALKIIDVLVKVFPKLTKDNELLVARLPSLSASRDLRSYIDQPLHKAFAVGAEGGWGWSSGRATAQEAEDHAVRECLKHSTSRDCQLYAIDNLPAPAHPTADAGVVRADGDARQIQPPRNKHSR